MASGGAEYGNELSVTDWDDKFWKTETKDPPFHNAAPHKTLLKYYDKLFETQKQARVFIPLCGKSLDLIYLADLGHDVVGLEFSKNAVDGFFAENDLKYTKAEKGKFVIYETIGKSITIFRGDFYDVTPEICGKFDVFWDRGSFTAINIKQRNEYAEIMFKLMKPTSTYLLQVTLYDGTLYGGPPHHVTEESLRATLGRKCSYELLEQKATEPLPIVRDIEWFVCVYFLQLKDIASL